MNEDDICNMIIMCAKARKDSTILQGFNANENVWVDTFRGLNCIVAAIVCDGIVFRIKPEPKTVSARIYWIKNYNLNLHSLGISTVSHSTEFMVENVEGFHSWAGDEQILVVPE